MSDQRKIRHELRQGLQQFTMGMYTSYLESHSEGEAKALVIDMLKEQLEMFTSEPLESADEVINQKIKYFQDRQHEAQDDPDSQLYCEEAIDALSSAKKFLKVTL